MLIPEALTREKGCTIQLDRLLISDIKCSVFLLAILNKCGATAKPVVEMIYLAAVQHGWSHCIFSRFNQVLTACCGVFQDLSQSWTGCFGFIQKLATPKSQGLSSSWTLRFLLKCEFIDSWVVSGQTQIIYCWWYLHDIPWYILMIFSILDL